VVGGLAAWGALAATSAIGTGAAGNIVRVLISTAVGLAVSYGALRLLRIDEMDYVDGLLRRIGSRIVPRRAV